MSRELPKHSLEKLLKEGEPILEEVRGQRKQLGKYRILRELGRGGMGIVYEAEDVDLKRRVALKLLALPPGAPDGLRERFLREAQAAARLNHPNIAAVYEATGEIIAMQLIDGPPLSKRPRMSQRVLVSYLRDVALAVHHAHEHGIVHRDIKPHNLLLEGDRLMVTDFGLAKETEVESSLSLSGHILGTPSYMAPEQASGRVHEVEPRTDVYGLGATLYDLLAGRPPFVAQDIVRLLRSVVEDDPPSIRSFEKSVSSDLETIVLKCLAKEKERRYTTADELAQDLTRWLDGEPVMARRASIRYRLTKFVQRRRALVAIATISMIAVLGTLLVAWVERSQRQASEMALALSEQVAAVLSDSEMHERLGEKQLAKERLNEGIRACKDFLDHHDVAHGHYLIGRLLRARGDAPTRAHRAFDRAIELDPTLADARLARGLLTAEALSNDLVRRQPLVAVDDVEGMPEDARRLRESAIEDLCVVELKAPALGLDRIDETLVKAELARLRGNRVQARRGFLEVLRLDRLNVSANRGLSHVELDRGDGDAAWYRAMALVDLQRGMGPAYLARSQAAPTLPDPTLGDFVRRAVSQHERAAGRKGEIHPARIIIDDVDGAVADLAAELAAHPGDAMAYGSRAVVQMRTAIRALAKDQTAEALDAWDSAILDCTSALTIQPGHAGALNNRGVARLEKARMLQSLSRATDASTERERAAQDFDAATRIDPEFDLPLLNRIMHIRRRAQLAASKQNPDVDTASGLADIRHLLRLRPNSADAILERALIRRARSELAVLRGESGEAESDAAISDFDLAVQLAPEDARCVGLRGIERLRRKDREGARSDLEAALGLSPSRRLRKQLEKGLAALDG